MNILFAVSESLPFIKVGGLADVAGTLSKHLKSRGHDVRIILPKYKNINKTKFGLKEMPHRFVVPVGDKYEVVMLMESLTESGIPVYFVESDKYFYRDGIYGDRGKDYPDNRERFIYFSRAVLETAKASGFKPDIIHCHDWQTGLVPVYLKTLYAGDKFFADTASVYTIHNIAYQGVFDPHTVQVAGLFPGDFVPHKLEYFGKFNFLKAGLVYADMLSTVSPTYAKEIQYEEWGRGMEGVLRERKSDLAGIINGVDYDEWNPKNDGLLASGFSSDDLKGKALCKADLQKTCGITVDPQTLLMGNVSRLDRQKGHDLIVESVQSLVGKENVQLVVLGSGDEKISSGLRDLAEKHPKKVYLCNDFNNDLAHKIYAGSDIFLMPSRFEPCGISQMISLAYGTVPVVSQTGGLVDTVSDFNVKTGKGNGIMLNSMTARELSNSIEKAIKLHKNQSSWKKLVSNGFASGFSWGPSVDKYIELYNSAMDRKKKTHG